MKCKFCSGKGADIFLIDACRVCKGTGEIENPSHGDVPCKFCNGKGADVEMPGPCRVCKGLTYIKRSKQLTKVKENEEYINPDRIAELKALNSTQFDLSKLIRLCEETNVSYAIGHYYSTGCLLRSILDHVPPIFNQDTFAQVVGQHGIRSFKESMKHLQDGLRKVSDSFLHDKIKRKVSLPKAQQVEFKSHLDLLLAEIITELS